jgi:hypothetical protein
MTPLAREGSDGTRTNSRQYSLYSSRLVSYRRMFLARTQRPEYQHSKSPLEQAPVYENGEISGLADAATDKSTNTSIFLYVDSYQRHYH